MRDAHTDEEPAETLDRCYRIRHEHYKHGEISLGLVLDQDSYNLPRVQKGMQSAAYKGLHISHQERRIRHMHRTVDQYLFGGGDGTGTAFGSPQ